MCCLTACVDEDVITVTPGSDGGPVLRLTTGGQVSRGDEHYPDDPYAEQPEAKIEEAINRIDLFFFTSSTTEGTAFYTYEVKNVSEVTTADLILRVPESMRSTFTNNNVYVYALVNLPGSVTVSAETNTINGDAVTLKNLKELWVDASEFAYSAKPTNFVMRGGANVTVSGNGDDMRISGSIMIERLAAKVRLWANIPHRVYIDAEGNYIQPEENESQADFENRASKIADQIWETELTGGSKNESQVMLYCTNMTTKGRIDAYLGNGTDVPDLGYEDIDRHSRIEVIRKLTDDRTGLNESDKDEEYDYTHTTAYYSYPNKWDSNLPSEEHRTTVIISVPWKRIDHGQNIFQNCYYQVPVNAIESNDIAADCLEPNHYYRIKLNIGMLGSKEMGDPLPVDASYEVLDWVTAPVDVTIKDRRYLVVNQKEWTMNNVHTLSIPFSTSHKTIVEGCYVTYFRYDETAWGTAINTSPAHQNEEFDAWVTAADKQLEAGREGEGYLEDVSFDGTEGNCLYYKSEYFKDPYLGYTYYFGHEHPFTFKKDIITYNSNMTTAEKSLWNEYNEKYNNINAVYTCEIDDKNSTIVFSHPLIQWKEVTNEEGESYYVPYVNKRIDAIDDEFSRCEISIIIKHEDWDSKKDGLYTETIHITQYPGLYVEVSHDYGSVGVMITRPTGNEYVFVNGNDLQTHTNTSGWNETTASIPNFGSINNNPNMYVIHTSKLSQNDEERFELGDPRVLFYNNELHDNTFPVFDNVVTNGYWYGLQGYVENKIGSGSNYPWGSTGAVLEDFLENIPIATGIRMYDENGERGILKYYYPTDETEGSGSKENFIAPAFRIASSFGKTLCNLVSTNPLYSHRTESRRRCASYQEAGRPAGRWRVPTMAEMEYLVQLSADGKIPPLFGYPASVAQHTEYTPYWTATGMVAIRSSDNTVKRVPIDSKEYTTIAVRCVYDEWYWLKEDGTPDLTPNGDLERAFYWGDKPKDNTQVQQAMRRYLNRHSK